MVLNSSLVKSHTFDIILIGFSQSPFNAMLKLAYNVCYFAQVMQITLPCDQYDHDTLFD